MDGEILVHSFALRTVMPVMKLGRGQKPPQRAELESDVRVYKRRLKTDEHDIGEQRSFGESENVDGDVRQTTGKHDIDYVKSGTGQPVHSLSGMVNRMKAP